ncbi:putative siderophore biosynthesis protein [Streptomyces sp. NBRC 110611]|uniref:IucA/IucC family protein n=1 Tax=Streptomyces sp. NBRC 110611 TaxID=1621259 RepID=UPI00083331CF|nr:IucA/IucC family protein [Streptomyces sp. NBRC 110611]GAU69619.1 putative siderophore biosynthesis protein [Streptomyces sp. NBRC 110611]
MNERPRPDEARSGEAADRHQSAGTLESVPRQQRRTPDDGGHRQTREAPARTALYGTAAQDRARPGADDPLDHPDPAVAADAAGIEHLLRCWLRENGTPRPPGNRLRIPLRATASALHIPVRYWSPTGWHRLDAPTLEGAPAGAAPLDAVTLAALLHREAGHGGPRRAPDGGEHRGAEAGERPDPDGGPPRTPDGDGAELVGRVADSVRKVATFLADRRTRPADDRGARFLEAEQSLLFGHPLHPTPKSREGLSDAETRAYSPELRGAFPLHWMAVDRSALVTDSAWTERGKAVPAERLVARLAGDGLEHPDGTVPLPLHPWQARELAHRPDIAALRDAGLLHDLGVHGPDWHPTSSVRTVYRPGADVMLKLSLGLRITNSRRENLRKELVRGVEVHRLLRTGLHEEWQAAHPGFDIVRDPAYLAVDGPGGEPVTGLDTVLRHNPFTTADDAVCIAGLTSPRPWPGRAGVRSRLEDLVAALGTRTGRPPGAVATEWFLRYLEAVVRPLLWLDGTVGVALEAHQQNTLVLLDPDGWPAGGRYRDNQGYYFRTSRRGELAQRLPGIGTVSDTFVADDVVDERFAYYLGINNVLGLIGAFGAQRLVREEILLAAFRRFLTDAAEAPAAHRSPLPEQLLSARTLRCKANLATRLHGLDELVGPVDTQSVYVTLPNPLAL